MFLIIWYFIKNIIIPARDNVWLEIILVINYTLKQMSYPDSGLFFVTIGTKKQNTYTNDKRSCLVNT